jgi:hypothetical protein
MIQQDQAQNHGHFHISKSRPQCKFSSEQKINDAVSPTPLSEEIVSVTLREAL